MTSYESFLNSRLVLKENTYKGALETTSGLPRPCYFPAETPLRLSRVMSKIAFFPNSALPLLKSKSLFSSKPVTFLVKLILDLAEASPRCVQHRCEIANVARPAFARTLILFWQHRMLQRDWLIDIKSLFEKSDAGSLAWQIDGCKDADQRHILEYIENRGRRRRPVAAPMRCRWSFQACSKIPWLPA